MKALIMVDIQKDFCPGGALEVPEGDQIIPGANLLQEHFDLVAATQDWHPASHLSFFVNHPGKGYGDIVIVAGLRQILWPVHCVQGTPGAELARGLRREHIDRIFYKGVDPEIDSYSGFFDNARRHSTGLEAWLREKGVQQVYIIGLATEYCVKYTALDAVELGFQTVVIEQACRGIDREADDVRRAIQEMRKAGVHVIDRLVV